jgi:hypothetical protein
MKDESLVESSAGEFPPSWLRKAENLLNLNGDARRDALVIFSHQLVWIYGRARAWAEAHLLSVFGQDREDERAFWSGFLWAAKARFDALGSAARAVACPGSNPAPS